jgi:hypothetical protein
LAGLSDFCVIFLNPFLMVETVSVSQA